MPDNMCRIFQPGLLSNGREHDKVLILQDCPDCLDQQSESDGSRGNHLLKRRDSKMLG